MDPVKEAFSKIKEEISSIREDIALLRTALLELHDKQLKTSLTPLEPFNTTALTINKPTNQQTNQHINMTPYGPIVKENTFSIGNGGVPTDKPTNQQTNQHTQNLAKNSEFKQVNEILESLDNIKKEIRLKFKKLTPQETTIFGVLYTFDSEGKEVTYKSLSEALHLSESSIRDYINKLVKKGIPIDKIRVNNKIILLKISPDLKKIASLETILSLRRL